MEINDKYIINEFFKIRLNTNKKTFTDDVKKYLKNRFKEFTSYKEVLYRIKYKIEEIPKCPVCGKNCKFNGRPKLIYLTYCSNECKKKSDLVGKHIIETMIKKYGKGKPDIISKMKKTCLKRYGVDIPLKSDKIKEKLKQTCLKRYGVENVAKSKQIQQKIINTRLDKYGYINFFCDKNIREKAKKSLNTNECKEKIKNTNLLRYGYEYYNQSPKARYNLHIKLSNPEIRRKIIETKKKNGTYKKSKKEDECYELLIKKYDNVIRQYRDENRYPFNCDFYIPNEDLFIEFNGYWTHGSHPYNNLSIDDNLIVKKWESKYQKENKELYKNAIKVWTQLDPNKRKIAKDNKLNYKEFFTVDQLINFIKNDNKENWNN